MQTAIRKKWVPRCLDLACNGLVKPEIVFFGEQLPAAFFEHRDLPMNADLCIVMGTSLSVHPFASLPSECDVSTPRLLINAERVGNLGYWPEDVLLLEDCDTGVRKLAKACGWLEELEALWAETAREDDPVPAKEETVRKTRDELLQEEVDKLTSEVEESLRLSKAQHEWLENHLDKKIARKREENEKSDERSTALSTDEPEPTELVRDTAKQDSNGGLGHVFPFLQKKPKKKVGFQT